MKTYFKSIFLAMLAVVAIACSEDDKPDTGRTVITPEKSGTKPFDVFLQREYQKPYNVQFLYKLPDIETNVNHYIVPAEYEKSVKMANLVKYLCLDAYNEVISPDFLKTYFPKMLLMVGSSAYQNNGTRLLGTAEGGLKISLYDVNSLDESNLAQLYDLYIRTIFHEFSHILHQTTDFSTEFRQITETAYVADSWNGISTANARTAGFVTPYSMKSPEEDFVEIIAHYVTFTDAQWEAMLVSAGTTGRPLLEQKISLVKDYMINIWKLDLDELKAVVQRRATNLPNVDLLDIN